MAAELFALEPFSVLKLVSRRTFAGDEQYLCIALDSGKNYNTKRLRRLSDAPTVKINRKEMLSTAVNSLWEKTTPEDLWAAICGHPFQELNVWDLILAAEKKVVTTATFTPANEYPRFKDGENLLVRYLDSKKIVNHPWR